MSFTFRDRMLKLNIAGNEFEIEIDAENNELMSCLGKEAIDVAKAYQTGKKTEFEAIDLFKEYINKVLDDKMAFDKIFANRTPDLRDCMDVMTYIADEKTAFIQANTPTLNRAQRRAAMKN